MHKKLKIITGFGCTGNKIHQNLLTVPADTGTVFL